MDSGVLRRRFLTALDDVEARHSQRHRSDVESLLRGILETGLSSVAGAQYACITTCDDRGQLHTMATTHDYAERLDDLHRDTGEGPLLSGAWSNHSILVADLATDVRWPRFRDAALPGNPIRAMMCFRIVQDGDQMASVNFHADGAGAFDDAAIEQGWIFALHTAGAWAATDRRPHIRGQLAGLDVVGQAKGVLVARLGIDAVTAFDLLHTLSKQDDEPIVSLAERLIADHASLSRE